MREAGAVQGPQCPHSSFLPLCLFKVCPVHPGMQLEEGCKSEESYSFILRHLLDFS